MKKTSLRNLLLVTLAVTVAKTFRINEIASRLPINVKTEKSKQKRLLRFLDTPFPLEAVKEVWCIFVLRCLWKKPQNYSFLLVDETELIDGWKAIVAAIPFRNRAIPVYWLIYRDQDIRDLTYKSHNKIVQDFCLKVYNLSLTASPKKAQRAPVFVFDRGFARAKYVIDFLKQRNIGFVMRICRNVGITVAGSSRRLDTLESGSYPNMLYHKTYQIPLNLYVVRKPRLQRTDVSHLKRLRGTSNTPLLQTQNADRTRLPGHQVYLRIRRNRFEKIDTLPHRSLMADCLFRLWTVVSLL